MRFAITIFICFIVASCASNKPINSTNYATDLVAPETAGPLVFYKREIFEDPLLGAMLRYQNPAFPSDKIDVFVYPIRDFDWSDAENTINGELTIAVGDVDKAIEYGAYESRTTEQITDITAMQGDQTLKGKKAEFTLTKKDEASNLSLVYMFIREDKYIKSRVTLENADGSSAMADASVREILKDLVIPPESQYMKDLRAQHKKQVQDQFMQLILQAVKQQAKDESESP